MKKAIILLIVFFIVFGFIAYKGNDKSKSHFITTFYLNNNLYVEKFEIYNWLGNPLGIYSDYLTDSIYFRKYIDTYNDYSFISYNCSKDSLYIKLVNREDTTKIYKKEAYELDSLKRLYNISIK